MLVKWGGGIVDGRGSIGGTTFSRNRYGAIARARTKPVNPKTALQSAVRALMATISQAWFALVSIAQRADWAVYAANVPAKNKLGEVINLTGFNMFVKSNMAAQNAGLPQILDGPAVFTLPGEDPTFAVVASEATQDLACTFDALAAWVDEDDAALIVQMGIPQNDSINFFDGPWRHAGAILGDGTTPPVTGDSVTAPFPIVAGQKIFTRARIILADGRLSDWFRVDSICGA
jgi:hypothetical protein